MNLDENKAKRVAELFIANDPLRFQNDEKDKRVAELVIANDQLCFQNEEKDKRIAELVIANDQLCFQNKEKDKRVAELVIASECRIAATVFESQEAMFVTDANSNILRVNRAFSRITGYSAEEAIGQTPRLISSGKQSKAFFDTMWQSINSIGGWAGEIWNKRKNGEVYPEHLTVTAVKDASGRVSNYVGTFTDTTKNKAASAKINSLAYFDPLTQLPNRRLLFDKLGHALASSARSHKCAALLLLDLDHFKILNDTLGHEAGDTLLQQVATRLINGVRKIDTVARLGGDEFVVLLENLSEQAIEAAAQTKNLANKIIFALTQPYQLGANEHRSTASIGATVFSGYELTSEELLRQVDIAMYQSKATGRNTLRFFDQTMQEAITVRADMENELRKAIKYKQFQLYYQIQVSSSGQALGAEALIRWQQPERGPISPFNFIPLAEETGLILPIGQWVLDTACAQLKAWQQSPQTEGLVLAVNISAKQFHQADFVEQVKTTLQEYEISPAQLKLELTESILVESISHIITKMNVLSKIGVLFSLDDFGTGYSSLQYLKKLPLNQLKIDQSFVRDLATDANDKAIVRTIITMAHSLDIDVIAEGVETVEQRQYLLDNGCMHYQGYLFSKPVPIDEFELLLSKS
ncbi:EAL domain-containing protein [Colwellia sp. MB3u-70]|uniref:putative bifunctional diguanylate cyclase/phosphodiesterase n=1 Tax=Colwellia sp. MB3u-70 TaxID=2759819 RepID=UPI0015F48251|nr:EAL domain-containing protein [Colwellia sp. MB3u-70]MBA6306966.1 EAL domain-containing protein [Colwellia sp. MB3u-70]